MTREAGRVDLSTYDNSWYQPGRPVLVRLLWLLIGQPILRSPWCVASSWRVALLRLFGARIGRNVVLRQHVKVKYPWHLVVGDNCWIGEEVWIDNLVAVRLGRNVCLSQGVYLCTGNHDWTDPGFALRVQSIDLDDGAWAGARAILLPGATLGQGAVVSSGAVVAGAVAAWHVVAGNPAIFIKVRSLREQATTSHPATEAVLS